VTGISGYDAAETNMAPMGANSTFDADISYTKEAISSTTSALDFITLQHLLDLTSVTIA